MYPLSIWYLMFTFYLNKVMFCSEVKQVLTRSLWCANEKLVTLGSVPLECCNRT